MKCSRKLDRHVWVCNASNIKPVYVKESTCACGKYSHKGGTLELSIPGTLKSIQKEVRKNKRECMGLRNLIGILQIL